MKVKRTRNNGTLSNPLVQAEHAVVFGQPHRLITHTTTAMNQIQQAWFSHAGPSTAVQTPQSLQDY